MPLTKALGLSFSTTTSSSLGEVPSTPSANIDAKSLRSILEAEFGITNKTRIQYGGKSISKDARISFRYFLMLNTISGDIITNSDVFFDKQNQERYREALPRVFDLAVGIDDIVNITRREVREKLETEIRRLEKKEEKIRSSGEAFFNETSELVKRAREFGVIGESQSALPPLDQLRTAVNGGAEQVISKWSGDRDRIVGQIQGLAKRVRSLSRFQGEYVRYKKNLEQAHDSVRPVIFLQEELPDLVKTSIFDDILKALQEEFESIRHSIGPLTPVDAQVSDLIEKHKKKIDELESEVRSLPEAPEVLKSDRDRYLFLGEVRAKLNLFTENVPGNAPGESSRLEEAKRDLEALQVVDIADRRSLFASQLNEISQGYINLAKDALDNYAGYKAFFNYREKRFQLRRPKSEVTEVIGSSSNHMFLHLFFFLGLHEVILRRSLPFVPSFLIIDQFSRPYYGEDGSRKEEMDRSDTVKITTALRLLDSFISNMVLEMKCDFQIILFEHVPPSMWSEMQNFTLSKSFGLAVMPW